MLCWDLRNLFFANDLMLCTDGLDDLIFVKIGSDRGRALSVRSTTLFARTARDS